MSKYSAEELSARVNDLELDDEVKISLMEDITDSLTPEENAELDSIKAELESLRAEYDSLKEKYKARFLSAAEVKEEEKPVEDEEEFEEKEVIDVKEI